MDYPAALASRLSGPAGARLIVCEQRGRWAAWLRRELVPVGVGLTETRLLADCWEVLDRLPASFLVLELSRANAGELLRRLEWLSRDYPAAQAAVVADRSLIACQWLVREAGAVHFLCSPRRVRLLAETACRHLAQAPAPPQDLADRIWSSLPWGQREE